MKQVWRRILTKILPKIWARLFAMIVMTVLLTWTVVGVAYVWLDTAQRVVTTLSTEQVPRLMQIASLANRTSELAVLSSRIFYTSGAEPEQLETDLRGVISELENLLKVAFDTSQSSAQSQRLQTELARVIRSLNRTRHMEENLRTKVERLRWLSVDLQDETGPLAADFSYNIQSLTRNLTEEPNAARRETLARILQKEQAFYGTFVSVENEASVVSTLVVQASASLDVAQLTQFSNLISDALSRMNAPLAALPRKAEYQTLQQSAQAVNALSVGPQSIVAARQAWLMERGALQDRLESSLVTLSNIQSRVNALTLKHQQGIFSLSERFTARSVNTMRLLVALTAFAALAGLAILFLYIRPSIIQPVERLTNAMRDIAAGREPVTSLDRSGHDEISKLARAVEMFRKSVKDRDAAIQKLRQTQSELVQAGKMAALGNLSAGISHELNQPLGAIRQRLHMAERALERDDPTASQEQITKINALVARMEKIINHLRRFARSAEYSSDTILLAPVIEGARDLLAGQMGDHSVRFEADDSLSGLCACGDQVLLEQVLVNLLSNATDAIAATGQPGKIVVRAEQAADGMVGFSVSDTGIGLGDLEPERAFDPFVSTKPPGEGLGLGLSISFNIITGMNGTLGLARRKGLGTRATIILPKGVMEHG